MREIELEQWWVVIETVLDVIKNDDPSVSRATL